MFKYLWIVILGIVLLIMVGVIVADIVKCSRKNYDYYIQQEHGGWKDVIVGTLVDIEDYTLGFLICVASLVMVASFIIFTLSMGGAE